MAKTKIALLSADPKNLAKLIDEYINLDSNLKHELKNQAFEIAQQNFSVEKLKPQYLNLIDGLRSKPTI
jgi:glycosyltransferase involved in cell wall biosynthesis